MNFILFNPDEMRADTLGCYGHPVSQTPNLDRLCAGGVRFDQCHVQHTVCSPSRCSAMTGWYPHTAGHRSLWHLLRPDEPSLFRYLKNAGYRIEWVGKNDLYAQEYLDEVVDRLGHERAAKGVGPGGPVYAPGAPGHMSFLWEPGPGKPEDHPDAKNVDLAVDFLRERKDGDPPFCLFMALSQPHPVYAAPEPFHSMYDADGLPPLRSFATENKPDFHRLIREYRQLDRLDEAVFRRIMAVYLGMCSYSDWLLGRVLDALDETGLAEDTCLVFYSDHGDWAGDYGLVEKWPSALDDCLTRIPFIIRAPGNRAGHVVEEPIEAFDMMATVLELAGVEAGHTHFARSLVPQLRGAPGDPDRAVYADGGYDPQEPQCFEGQPGYGDDIHHVNPHAIYYPKLKQQQDAPESVCRSAMIRTMTHKLIRRTDGLHELYDYAADPHEEKNVYADPACADVRAELESRLLDRQLRTSDAPPPDRDPRGFTHPIG